MLLLLLLLLSMLLLLVVLLLLLLGFLPLPLIVVVDLLLLPFAIAHVVSVVVVVVAGLLRLLSSSVLSLSLLLGCYFGVQPAGATIRAASRAVSGGVPSVVIASGLNPYSIERIVCGEK